MKHIVICVKCGDIIRDSSKQTHLSKCGVEDVLLYESSNERFAGETILEYLYGGHYD